MYLGPQDPNIQTAQFQEEQRIDAGELICKRIIKRNLSAPRRELRLKKTLSLQSDVFRAVFQAVLKRRTT